PLAGGIQALVHRLVTAALLVSTAAAAAPALAPAAALAATSPAAAAAVRDVTPAGAIPGQSLPPALLVAPAANGGAHRLLGPSDIRQEFQPGNGSPGRNGTQATAARPDGEQDRWAHRTEKIYVVKPPVGRFHESLWEIAENHLGDGRRYQEIFELNKDLPQPDGSMLTIASLIRPGSRRTGPRHAAPGFRLGARHQWPIGNQPALIRPVRPRTVRPRPVCPRTRAARTRAGHPRACRARPRRAAVLPTGTRRR